MANPPLGPNESGIARTLVRPFGRLIGHTASQSYNPSPGGMGGPSYDTDAAAYFSAVETAGGSFDLTGINATYTESYVKTAHSDFYAGLKTDGLWSKLTEFYLLVGKTFDGLTVKGKGTGTLTNNNFVSGDLLAAGAGAGLGGDGSTKYIDTGLSVSSGNNKSLSYYATLAQTDGTSVGIISADNGSLTNGLSLGRISGGTLDEFNSGSTSTFRVTVAQASSNGCFIGSARTLTDRELYKNGSTIGSSSAAMADMTTPRTLQVFANNGALISDATLTFAHIGTGLTDTDATNLSLRVNKLMYDLGCETYIDQGILDAMTLDADAQTYAEAVLSAGGNFEAI